MKHKARGNSLNQFNFLCCWLSVYGKMFLETCSIVQRFFLQVTNFWCNLLNFSLLWDQRFINLSTFTPRKIWAISKDNLFPSDLTERLLTTSLMKNNIFALGENFHTFFPHVNTRMRKNYSRWEVVRSLRAGVL